MEIKLNEGEKCKINYGHCPRCGVLFGAKEKKKTFHHAIPMFLKPRTEIEVSLCKKCHDELNSHYVHQAGNINDIIGKNQPKTFEEFLNNYKLLRDDFNKKTKGKEKTVNGKFGEALWFNLVNFLKALSEEVEAKK